MSLRLAGERGGRTGARGRLRGWRPRGLGWGLVLGLTLLASAAVATAIAASPARPSAARLQGFFLLSGRVIVATNVRGEHVGERVQRIWAFDPLCPAGSCDHVRLVRIRPGGRDQVLLHRVGPAYYIGRGRFYAPLSCAQRIYPKGDAVPFKVTVRITAAKLSGTAVLATHIRASYTNRSRPNLTPCVTAPGHDAAAYHGHLL